MAGSSMDGSWVGDKVLARLGCVKPQEEVINPAFPEAKDDMPPPYSVPSYPSTIGGYEIRSMGSSPISFQGKLASSLHQAKSLLPFPATEGQMKGYVVKAHLPEIALLSSEVALVPDRQHIDANFTPAIHKGSTDLVVGSPSRSMTFLRTINQSHPASPAQGEHSSSSHSAPRGSASMANPAVLLNSSKPSNTVPLSDEALQARPIDCFYIDTAGSPRLRPSLRISDSLGSQQTDTTGAPKIQVESTGLGSKTHDSSKILKPLGQRNGSSQRLPIRSVTTEASLKIGPAASQLARQVMTAPSQPRAMREIKGTETKAIKAVESCKVGKPLPRQREVDLTKWPCRTCQFVHRGSECETVCIGCGANTPDQHDPKCPYKSKTRLEGFKYSAVKQEGGLHEKGSFQNTPSELFTNSVTTKLSVECQKRGFNPEFRYYGNEKTGKFMAELRVKDKMVSGEGRVYRSQKEARDVLAEKGLEIVLLMDRPQPVRRPPELTRKMSQPEDSSLDKQFQRSTGEPPLLKHHLVAKARMRSGIRFTDGEPSFEYHNRMDIDKSDEGTRKNRAESSSNLVTNSMKVTSMPTNIDARDVPGFIEKILSSGPSSITFNLPANVSTEIAEAYGRGFAMNMHRRRHTRSHSRSRSPPRDRFQVDRDYRERNEYNNRSGRLHIRDEYRPVRDEYRITRDREIMYDGTRKNVAGDRLRLSPHADIKSQRHIKAEPKSPDAQRLYKRH